MSLVETVKQSKSREVVKSHGNSLILSINASKTIKIIREETKDYEAFCILRDTFMFNPQSLVLVSVCGMCKLTGHSSATCPRCHFIAKRDVVIAKYRKVKNMKQERKWVYRHKLRKPARHSMGRMEVLSLAGKSVTRGDRRKHTVEFHCDEAHMDGALTTLKDVDAVNVWSVYCPEWNMHYV